jgi:hypothetical protein
LIFETIFPDPSNFWGCKGIRFLIQNNGSGIFISDFSQRSVKKIMPEAKTVIFAPSEPNLKSKNLQSGRHRIFKVRLL